MNTILDTVHSFASKAHQGQMRKYSPEPYIVHPVRVSEMVRFYNPRIPVLAAALLHDVVEDTSVCEIALNVFLHNTMEPKEAAETLRLVMQLTDVYTKSSYPQLNRRKRKQLEAERLATISPDAQTIKYADIIDNTSKMDAFEPEFAPEYLKECLTILEKADKGNPSLRAKALDSVKNGLYAVQRD